MRPAASPTTSQVVSSPDTPAADGSVEQVAAAVLPSVVKLDVSNGQQAGSGSGIILSSDGQILTNNHVAEVAGNGGQITVSFSDGTHAPATIVGTDPLTDTAVVQAEGVSGLTPATIGSSSDVAVGEEVVAIGSPFGLDATVTSGIVSALARPVNVGSDAAGNATVYPAIQTDAAINPGNSGGPLVDLQGHVIGINSSIQSTSTTGGESGSIGLGFAIPIDEVLPVIDQMKNGETPTHAKLGVSVEDVATGAQVADGAQIRTIGDGSAAERRRPADRRRDHQGGRHPDHELRLPRRDRAVLPPRRQGHGDLHPRRRGEHHGPHAGLRRGRLELVTRTRSAAPLTGPA